MPIQIRNVQSLQTVDARLRDFEAQYGVTSAEFAANRDAQAKVPEFDAIEWNYLLMQKSAMEEDDLCGNARFFSGYTSKTQAVDAYEVYEEVAA